MDPRIFIAQTPNTDGKQPKPFQQSRASSNDDEQEDPKNFHLNNLIKVTSKLDLERFVSCHRRLRQKGDK